MACAARLFDNPGIPTTNVQPPRGTNLRGCAERTRRSCGHGCVHLSASTAPSQPAPGRSSPVTDETADEPGAHIEMDSFRNERRPPRLIRRPGGSSRVMVEIADEPGARFRVLSDRNVALSRSKPGPLADDGVLAIRASRDDARVAKNVEYSRLKPHCKEYASVSIL